MRDGPWADRRRAGWTLGLWLLLGCAPATDDRLQLGPWELKVRGSIVASQSDGLHVILSDEESVCSKVVAQYRCSRARFDPVDLMGVTLDVELPGRGPGRYAVPEASARFTGVSATERFTSTARGGSIELVAYKPDSAATIVLDLEMDTGVSLRGRFVASGCNDIGLVRPFGGLACTGTREGRTCPADAGTGALVTCIQIDEQCTCGGESSSSSCLQVSTALPTTVRYGCTCQTPAGERSCAIQHVPLDRPHCCEGVP